MLLLSRPCCGALTCRQQPFRASPPSAGQRDLVVALSRWVVRCVAATRGSPSCLPPSAQTRFNHVCHLCTTHCCCVFLSILQVYHKPDRQRLPLLGGDGGGVQGHEGCRNSGKNRPPPRARKPRWRTFVFFFISGAVLYYCTIVVNSFFLFPLSVVDVLVSLPRRLLWCLLIEVLPLRWNLCFRAAQ